MKTLLAVLICASLLFACDQNDSAPPSVSGQWILYEQGYSPGAEYITEDIPLVPPQTLKLNSNGSLETTIRGWAKYKYFLILDEGDDKKVLALFEERPLDPNPDLKTLEVSYDMAVDEEGNLKLYFRWCIEGCHLALKKY